MAQSCCTGLAQDIQCPQRFQNIIYPFSSLDRDSELGLVAETARAAFTDEDDDFAAPHLGVIAAAEPPASVRI